MRVGLVIPPSPFLLDDKVFVSLGILKVAASLEMRGHAVEVIDLAGVQAYEDAVSSVSLPAVVGITATTPQMPAATKLAARLRESGSKVILGGPHATVVHAAAKKGVPRAVSALSGLMDIADIVVTGDGEDAIEAAIIAEPGTLIDADDPSKPWFMTNERLDKTPWPCRHLVDLDSYHYTIDGARATSLVCQLGCPFGCAFCSGRSSPMLRRIRSRSTDNVLGEVANIHQTYGYEGIQFYDDELNVSRSMLSLMHGLAELGRERGVEWKLRGFIKSELFTREQADAMREAGFRWILVGFESGSPRILENIRKQATVEDNDRCLETAHAAGLKVKALMSLGHAGETVETVNQTCDWLLRTKPDDFDATVITPYPGCPYYDAAVETDPGVWTFAAKSGDRLHAEEVDYTTTADYYKGAPGAYVSHVWTDELSRGDLVSLRDGLEVDVRAALGIAFPTARTASVEQSMGQSRSAA